MRSSRSRAEAGFLLDLAQRRRFRILPALHQPGGALGRSPGQPRGEGGQAELLDQRHRVAHRVVGQHGAAAAAPPQLPGQLAATGCRRSGCSGSARAGAGSGRPRPPRPPAPSSPGMRRDGRRLGWSGLHAARTLPSAPNAVHGHRNPRQARPPARLALARARRRAVLLVLGAAAVFSVAGAFVKALDGAIPLAQVVFCRNLFCIPVLLPLLLREGGVSALRMRAPWMHACAHRGRAARHVRAPSTATRPCRSPPSPRSASPCRCS